MWHIVHSWVNVIRKINLTFLLEDAGICGSFKYFKHDGISFLVILTDCQLRHIILIYCCVSNNFHSPDFFNDFWNLWFSFLLKFSSNDISNTSRYMGIRTISWFLLFFPDLWNRLFSPYIICLWFLEVFRTLCKFLPESHFVGRFSISFQLLRPI